MLERRSGLLAWPERQAASKLFVAATTRSRCVLEHGGDFHSAAFAVEGARDGFLVVADKPPFAILQFLDLVPVYSFDFRHRSISISDSGRHDTVQWHYFPTQTSEAGYA
uniref:Uncharacterized protein n=1 Tax=Tanacetum cinerariifolium TaxID=118510 RepID=A0A699WVT1_TANCI|nr:hypothetical protein [Tanacetum cinerariifolium]